MGNYLSIYMGPFVRLESRVEETTELIDLCKHPDNCPMKPSDGGFCPKCGVNQDKRTKMKKTSHYVPDFDDMWHGDEEIDEEFHDEFRITERHETKGRAWDSPITKIVYILKPNQRGIFERETSIDPPEDNNCFPIPDEATRQAEIRAFEERYATWLDRIRKFWPTLEVQWGVVTNYS